MRRVALYITAAVVLFCGAFVPQHTLAQCSKELTHYTDALKRYIIYGDTTQARQLINQALAEDSTYMPAAYLLSRIEQDNQKSWEAAEMAAKADSTNHHLLQHAAEKALSAHKYSEAKGLFERLITSSHNPDHFRILAILYNLSKEPSRAVAVLDSAEVRLGKIDYLNRVRQQIYLDGGESEKAIKSAREGVESAPYDPENHLALADVYAAIGADSLADVSYNTAINLDNTNPSAWFDYARYLDSRKRYTEMLLVWRNVVDLKEVPQQSKLGIVESITAKRDFYRKNFLLIEPIITRLYELYPSNERVTELYTTHLLAGNRVEKALEIIKSTVKNQTPTLEEINKIIEIENYIERTDSVKYYADKGIELYPSNADFWNLKAWLQMRENDNKGAIKTLKAALDFAEDNTARSSLWGSIGDQYYDLGKERTSYAAYNKALHYNHDNAVVLNNYAYHLSIAETSLKDALKMAKRATELSPNNATYLDTLAWVYYKMGEYEQAKKFMQEAISFDKENSSELALHYGDILDTLGSTFMAQVYWRKALERGADAEMIQSRLNSQNARLEAEK